MPLDADALADIVLDVLRPLVDRVADLERRAGHIDHTIGNLRERCAVLETRAPVPGPPGADGVNGRDGIAGKDGADGLGVGDLTVEYDGERAITIKAIRDDVTRLVGALDLPIPIDRGVWSPSLKYARGDLVSYSGSGWIARKDTTAQPGTDDGREAWRLFVKRGDRGRDLRAVS